MIVNPWASWMVAAALRSLNCRAVPIAFTTSWLVRVNFSLAGMIVLALRARPCRLPFGSCNQ